MPWLQVRIHAGRAHTGRAEALLEILGALSVTLEDAADQPLLEPAPGATPIWEDAYVTGLFDAAVDPGNLVTAIDHGMQGTGAEVVAERLADQPWERAWLKHFRPMRFGRRLWVCPHDQDIPAAREGTDAVVLRLDPGMAFGTGSHATTALCLEWLDSAELAHKTVIDYGCGSGILAIASLLLGAASVLAVDHDPQALIATRDNATANGVVARIVVADSHESIGKPADVVLGNILAATLIDLAGTILNLVRPGGQLILSGILEEQADAVIAAYQPKIVFAPPRKREGWVLLGGIRRMPREA
jgi:ribosomal protein L11 methyltransferase